MEILGSGLGQDGRKSQGKLVKMFRIPERLMTIEWWSDYHAEIRPVAAEVTNALPEEVEQVVGGGDEGATILGGQQHLGNGREDQAVGLGTNLSQCWSKTSESSAGNNLSTFSYFHARQC